MDRIQRMAALVVMMLLIGGFLNAAYRTNWKYNTSDLSGAQCLQVAVDDHEDRIDDLELFPAQEFDGGNNDVLTPTSQYVLATPSGSANGYTNTCTISNPLSVGKMLYIAIASGATNCMGLADSGNLKLSAVFVGNADDTLTLISTATNVWAEVSRSSN